MELEARDAITQIAKRCTRVFKNHRVLLQKRDGGDGRTLHYLRYFKRTQLPPEAPSHGSVDRLGIIRNLRYETGGIIRNGCHDVRNEGCGAIAGLWLCL